MEKLKDAGRNSKIDIFFVFLIVLSVCLRFYNLDVPISNDFYHSFRTSQTAIVIQNYFRDGFSLFNYSVPVFGKPWSVMFEFPLYQAVVYFVLVILRSTSIDLCARIISIIIFYIGVIYLYKIVFKLTDRNAAKLVIVIYSLSAYTIYWSRAVLVDYMSVMFALMYIFYFYEWIHGCHIYKNLIRGVICGSMGYLVKITSMFPGVFFLALLIISYEYNAIKYIKGDTLKDKLIKYIKDNPKRLAGYCLITILPFLSGLLWTRYTDELRMMSKFTLFLITDNLHSWNYGTLGQKIELSNWNVILGRYSSFFGGFFSLFGLLLAYVSISKRKYSKIIIYSFVSQFLTVFILFNLYYVHNYYLIALSPYIFMIYGLIVHEIIQSLSTGTEARLVIILCACLLVNTQYNNNADYVSGIISVSPVNRNIGLFINRITKPDELVIVSGEDWSSNVLYNADRKGFMIKDDDVLYDDDLFEFIDDDSYTTLVVKDISVADYFIDNNMSLIQYAICDDGKINDVIHNYVYKFKSPNKTEQTLDEYNFKYYPGTILNFEKFDTKMLFGIDYNVDEDTIIQANLYDKDNKKYITYIALPASSTHIDVDLSYICNEISEIDIL